MFRAKKNPKEGIAKTIKWFLTTQISTQIPFNSMSSACLSVIFIWAKDNGSTYSDVRRG